MGGEIGCFSERDVDWEEDLDKLGCINLGGQGIMQFPIKEYSIPGTLPKISNKGWTIWQSFRFNTVESKVDVCWSLPDNLFVLLDNSEYLFDLVAEYVGHAYLVTVLCHSNGVRPSYIWNMEWNRKKPIKMTTPGRKDASRGWIVFSFLPVGVQGPTSLDFRSDLIARKFVCCLEGKHLEEGANL